MEVIMPEIPEMEIYKDYLNKWVKDQQISEVNVLHTKYILYQLLFWYGQLSRKRATLRLLYRENVRKLV